MAEKRHETWEERVAESKKRALERKNDEENKVHPIDVMINGILFHAVTRIESKGNGNIWTIFNEHGEVATISPSMITGIVIDNGEVPVVWDAQSGKAHPIPTYLPDTTDVLFL